MTDFTKNTHETIASHFGLGSSTRGKTMDEQNQGRSEAEFLAERALSQHRKDWETPADAAARCKREALREDLETLRERRTELELSDNYCHTNGRLARIDRQIAAVTAKLEGREDTSGRDAFRNAREQFDLHMDQAIAACRDGLGELRAADLARYREYMVQTYWNVDPRKED